MRSGDLELPPDVSKKAVRREADFFLITLSDAAKEAMRTNGKKEVYSYIYVILLDINSGNPILQASPGGWRAIRHLHRPLFGDDFDASDFSDSSVDSDASDASDISDASVDSDASDASDISDASVDSDDDEITDDRRRRIKCKYNVCLGILASRGFKFAKEYNPDYPRLDDNCDVLILPYKKFTRI